MLGFLTVAFDSIYALVFVITISGTDIGNVNNNNNEAKEKKNVACVRVCASVPSVWKSVQLAYPNNTRIKIKKTKKKKGARKHLYVTLVRK